MPTDSGSSADFQSQLAEVARDPQRRIDALHALLGEGACRQLGIYPIPEGFKLSVVIPVYNEERWIREIVRRVRAVPIPKEVILVDDCSKDGTRKILDEEISKLPDCRVDSARAQPGQGGWPADGLQARDRRRRHRPGRRPGVRSRRVSAAVAADHRGQGRRRVRLALHRRQSPRAVLLALRSPTNA